MQRLLFATPVQSKVRLGKSCDLSRNSHFVHYSFAATGYPLFPGENEVEQLACIMEVMGLPPQNILEQATRRRLFFGEK